MTNVEMLIREEATYIAKKQSMFITSKDDMVKSTISILSSKGNELKDMMGEVEAFNSRKEEI